MNNLKAIRLVDDTMGASYTDNYLNFNPEFVTHFIEHKNRIMLSGKVCPSVVEIFFLGNKEGYRVLLEDFIKVTNKRNG